jgi:hypothetical protein
MLCIVHCQNKRVTAAPAVLGGESNHQMRGVEVAEGRGSEGERRRTGDEKDARGTRRITGAHERKHYSSDKSGKYKK